MVLFFIRDVLHHNSYHAIVEEVRGSIPRSPQLFVEWCAERIR